MATSLCFFPPKQPKKKGLKPQLYKGISNSLCHLNTLSWFLDALLAAVPVANRGTPQGDIRVLLEMSSRSLQRAVEYLAFASANVALEQRDRFLASWHPDLPSYLPAEAMHKPLLAGCLFQGLQEQVMNASRQAALASYNFRQAPKRPANKPPPAPAKPQQPKQNSRPPPAKRPKKAQQKKGKGGNQKGRNPKGKP